VAQVASASTPEATLRRIEAILACRRALARNVTPLLAVEAMAIALRPQA
jgi:DNA polymerase-3 subunit delta'